MTDKHADRPELNLSRAYQLLEVVKSSREYPFLKPMTDVALAELREMADGFTQPYHEAEPTPATVAHFDEADAKPVETVLPASAITNQPVEADEVMRDRQGNRVVVADRSLPREVLPGEPVSPTGRQPLPGEEVVITNRGPATDVPSTPETTTERRA